MRMSPRADKITALFLAVSRSAYRRAFVALTILVLLTFTLCLALGCSHQALFPCDAAILLEGGWRLYQGQRPHTDFYSPLGVVPLLMTASGMWLLGPDDRALQTGYTLLFPLATFAAWALARRRFPAFPAFLFAALIGVLLVGMRSLNVAYWFASYAMQYNRLGWVLFCLLALTLLVPPRMPPSRRQEWLEGIAIGVLLALLAFTKVNYVVMGLALLVASVLLFGVAWRTFVGLLIGGTAATLALLAYLHFDAAAIIGDLRMLSGAQKLPERLRDLGEVTARNAPWLVLLVLLVILLSQPSRREEADRAAFPWPRWVLAALLLVGVGLVICSANSQHLDIPTFGFAALILVEGFRRRHVPATSGNELPADSRRTFLLASLAAAGLVGMILLTDLASIVYSFSWPFRPTEIAQAIAIDSERLPHLRMQKLDDDRKDPRPVEQAILEGPKEQEHFFAAYQYGAWVNDALALLRKHVKPDSRVVVFDWINPFSFALGLASPRGDALWWHYGRVMDENHHPPAERILHDATLVIVPRRSSHPHDTKFLERCCGSLLNTEFEELDESRLWVLYGRKTVKRGEGK
jgi:hypothetical protein